MKITNVRIRTIEDKQQTPIGNAMGIGFRGVWKHDIVEVFTDEGITGVVPSGGLTETAKHLIMNKLKPVIIGEDPINYERVWRKMFGEERGWVYLSYNGETLRAISAVDTAIWDLIGKTFNTPVYRLLGGYRDRVPCYASGGHYVSLTDHTANLRFLEAQMAQYMDMHFKAVKMRAGLEIARDCERAKVVRDVIGPDVDLMIDFNFSQTYRGGVPQAIKFIRALEEYNPYWIEDPLAPDDVTGMKQISDAVDTAIASGEREQTLWGFRDLIVNRAVDILVPDPENMCGGITEWRRIAAMADAFRIPVAAHGAEGTHIHCVASIANGLTVEVFCPGELSRMRYAIEPLMPNSEGLLEVPQKPGFGIELEEEYIKAHLVALWE